MLACSNPQLNSLFQQSRQQMQTIYGPNSSQYQTLINQQKEVIPLLNSTNPEKQNKYLSLISQIQALGAKTFNEQTKTLDISRLSKNEQKRFMDLNREMEGFVRELKKEQMKSEQKDRKVKLV